VDALLATITLLDQWLKGNDTDPDLRECIYEYAMGRGEVLMENICLEHGYDEQYVKMAKAQDSIGWRRFMEGMVSKEMRNIQRTHASVSGMRHNTERWGVELVTRLLEVTHGQ
jgi:hypothetical protein